MISTFGVCPDELRLVKAHHGRIACCRTGDERIRDMNRRFIRSQGAPHAGQAARVLAAPIPSPALSGPNVLAGQGGEDARSRISGSGEGYDSGLMIGMNVMKGSEVCMQIGNEVLCATLGAHCGGRRNLEISLSVFDQN